MKSTNSSTTRRDLQQRLERSEVHLAEIQVRLDLVLELNGLLVKVLDENALMERVMALVAKLTGAAGCSYVPLDELGQALAILQQGNFPEDLRQAWMKSLASPEVRQACRECQLRRSGQKRGCLLANPPYLPPGELYCLPLRLGDQSLGVLNLYIPQTQSLSKDLRLFLDGILNEIALAVKTLRLHSQEKATLRQLQMDRSEKVNLPVLLKGLLEEVQLALEADYSLLWLPAGERHFQQTLLGKAPSELLATAEGLAFVDEVVRLEKPATFSRADEGSLLPPEVGEVLAAPLVGMEGAILGVIMVGKAHPGVFYSSQSKVLQAVASQLAVLVANEYFLVDVEYKAVSEERARLAREIHDGLAQTMAYLKLQAAQMQAYLEHGDLDRLKTALQANHQTLSAAYLDTRQAIDNLRVIPQARLSEWLEQIAREYTDSGGLQIQVQIQSDPPGLAPEVQSQLIRVVQEALTNVRRHAHARGVVISLREWERDLILEVQDDGQGFSPDEIPRISQYGLRGMRERAELIGADFQIISHPNQGTTVRLRLPFPVKETAYEQ